MSRCHDCAGLCRIVQDCADCNGWISVEEMVPSEGFLTIWESARGQSDDPKIHMSKRDKPNCIIACSYQVKSLR